jgi:hypothetical protein
MGSGGSTEQQSSQQSVSQTQLPPWINQAAQQNYALAQDIANRPLQQYQGQQVADVGPQMQQAWNLAAGSGAAGADQYNASQAGFLTAAATPATQVTPQTLAKTDLTPYMNPYTQNVINATLPIMGQQTAQALMGIGDQATTSRAFGGSRQGVAEGTAAAQGGLNAAQMAAQLNQANFGQAQTAATGDITRDLTAQQSNQTANQANINSLIAAAGGLGTLGSQAQQNQRQQFLELSTAGAQQQQQAQNQINANMNQFSQAWAYPGQQLGVLQSALGMTPYGSTTTGSSSGTSTTTQNPSAMSDVFGGLQALGGMVGQGGPFAGLLTGSDRHLKTDVAKVGVHGKTGLPIYSYRYKGDPKSYPKVTGPMAEDAMQVAPHAVRTVGVHPSTGESVHGVDMGALDAMPAIRPRRMPGASGATAARMVPGALAPAAPTGLVGAMGASMRAPKLKARGTLPQVRGRLGGPLA